MTHFKYTFIFPEVKYPKLIKSDSKVIYNVIKGHFIHQKILKNKDNCFHH